MESSMTPNELYKQKVLDCCEKNAFIISDGGSWYFSPDGNGSWSASDLAIISTELERRNQDWYDHIEKHLGSPDRPKTFSST